MQEQPAVGCISGKTLAAYRRRRGYSQQELAARAQLPLAEVARLEQGYVAAAPLCLLLPQEAENPPLEAVPSASSAAREAPAHAGGDPLPIR